MRHTHRADGDERLAGPREAIPVVKLEVRAAMALGTPPVETMEYAAGSVVTCRVANARQDDSGIRRTCTGWLGTGSVPFVGDDSEVSFTILTKMMAPVIF